MGIQTMKRMMLNVALSAAFVLAGSAACAASEVATKSAAALEPYKKLPEFQAAGEPFDAKPCMAYKSIISIPASSAIPFLKTINDSMTKIATQVGFKLHVWENQGQVTQWVQGIDYAIANKFNLIDLLAGSDPRFLEPDRKSVV